jgi:hypothetical protein
MKDINGSEDWRVLCELASKEKDPEKLIDLVVKINQALPGVRGVPSETSLSRRRKCVQRCYSNLAAR